MVDGAAGIPTDDVGRVVELNALPFLGESRVQFASRAPANEERK